MNAENASSNQQRLPSAARRAPTFDLPFHPRPATRHRFHTSRYVCGRREVHRSTVLRGLDIRSIPSITLRSPPMVVVPDMVLCVVHAPFPFSFVAGL